MASNMMLYWGSGSPPCFKAMIVLEEKGLQGYGQKLLSFSEKEHKGEEVMKLNPRGQVPTFKDGDLVINESGAICEYLEYKYAGQGTQLMPQDAAQRGKVLQRMHESQNISKNVMETVVRYYFMTKAEDVDEAVIKPKKEEAREEFKRWEGYLAKEGPDGYMAGKDFTMADVYVYPLLAFCVRNKLNLDPFPCLKSYYEKVTQRPSVKASWPPHWKDSEGKDMFQGV